MPDLIELTARIVSSHAKSRSMTTEELIHDIQLIHAGLQLMKSGAGAEPVALAEPTPPTLTIKQAFKKDEVVCMICRKGGFKTLSRHLKTAHDLKPGEYRKQFGIKSTQKLAARSFSEARRQSAFDRGMVAILAKARETRMANIAKKKAAVPAVRVTVAVPAVKTKLGVPAAAKKTASGKPVKQK
jgi:predicted transcriptional regulator